MSEAGRVVLVVGSRAFGVFAKESIVWRNNGWAKVGSLSSKPKKLRAKRIAEKKARRANR